MFDLWRLNCNEQDVVMDGLFARAAVALFKQSFHSIGQKKNEAIALAQSDVTVEKDRDAVIEI